MKTCTKCGEEKPLSEFSRNRNRLRGDCKECRAAYHRKYAKENREKKRAADKKYRLNNKEKISKKAHEYHKKNKEKRNTYALDRYYADHDKNKQRSLIWQRENREHYNERKSLAVKNLSTGYCTDILKQKGFPKEQITPELIEAQRALIKLKRAIKEKA